MQNRKDIDAAHQAWKDRQGIPRGTPEQGERSADRVGGSGPAQPEPEIEDEDSAPATRRAPEGGGVDSERDKRRATRADEEPGEP
jgi:hypothetical protein